MIKVEFDADVINMKICLRSFGRRMIQQQRIAREMISALSIVQLSFIRIPSKNRRLKSHAKSE